jgi:hypothetical protein
MILILFLTGLLVTVAILGAYLGVRWEERGHKKNMLDR